MPDDPGADEVYCRDCGAIIKQRAEICPECGIRQQEPEYPQSPAVEEKDSGLAAVASFLIPGLGQVYNGQIAKGIFAGIGVIAFALTGIGLLITAPLWIWLIYDAYSYTPPTPGNKSSGQSHQSSVFDQHDIPEKKATRKALEWYEAHGPKAGLTASTKKQFQNAPSLEKLSHPQLRRIRDAIDAYREENESSSEIETVHEDITTELETRR